MGKYQGTYYKIFGSKTFGIVPLMQHGVWVTSIGKVLLYMYSKSFPFHLN